MNRRLLMIACAITALGACGTTTMAPTRPVFDLPKLADGAKQSDTNAAPTDWAAWWKSFKDPVLDKLLQEAISQSQDLKLASARIDEARATLDANRVNFLPTVDLNVNTSRKGSSENAASARPGVPTASSDWQYGFTAAYEFDFWGKYARADDAARARLLSQTASRGTVLVSLYANIAQTYFALRAADAQVALAETTLATRTENVRLQTRRAQAGLTSDLDLRQAESEAANIESLLRAAKQNQKNLETALCVLVGRSPAQVRQGVIERGANLNALYEQAALPADLPSDLLTRRPDLIAAEQLLIANQADLALARTAYYPRISLSAGLGQQSRSLADLLQPASLFWNLLGNLAQPIFRAGAVDSAVAAASARETQAVAQYTLAVQAAFRDVQDALNNYQASRDLVLLSQKRVTALNSTLRLSEIRYKGGYSSYLEVLSAQRDLAQAQTGLIDIQRSQLNAVIGLYKAMGGGWSLGN
jgi:outer membrane protein, multidrug efflux system